MTKVIKIKKEEENILEIYEALGYQILSKEDKGSFYRVYLSIEENEKLPKIQSLEKGIILKKLPFAPIGITCITAIVLITIFVLLLFLGNNFDLLTNVFIFVVPSGVLLLFAMFYTHFYFQRNQKILENKKYSISEYKNIIQKELEN